MSPRALHVTSCVKLRTNNAENSKTPYTTLTIKRMTIKLKLRPCSQQYFPTKRRPAYCVTKHKISNYKYRNSIFYLATCVNACLDPWDVVWAALPLTSIGRRSHCITSQSSIAVTTFLECHSQYQTVPCTTLPRDDKCQTKT